MSERYCCDSNCEQGRCCPAADEIGDIRSMQALTLAIAIVGLVAAVFVLL